MVILCSLFPYDSHYFSHLTLVDSELSFANLKCSDSHSYLVPGWVFISTDTDWVFQTGQACAWTIASLVLVLVVYSLLLYNSCVLHLLKLAGLKPERSAGTNLQFCGALRVMHMRKLMISYLWITSATKVLRLFNSAISVSLGF